MNKIQEYIKSLDYISYIDYLDETTYFKENPELDKLNINAKQHWIKYGLIQNKNFPFNKK